MVKDLGGITLSYISGLDFIILLGCRYPGKNEIILVIGLELLQNEAPLIVEKLNGGNDEGKVHDLPDNDPFTKD